MFIFISFLVYFGTKHYPLTSDLMRIVSNDIRGTTHLRCENNFHCNQVRSYVSIALLMFLVMYTSSCHI